MTYLVYLPTIVVWALILVALVVSSLITLTPFWPRWTFLNTSLLRPHIYYSRDDGPNSGPSRTRFFSRPEPSSFSRRRPNISALNSIIQEHLQMPCLSSNLNYGQWPRSTRIIRISNSYLHSISKNPIWILTHYSTRGDPQSPSYRDFKLQKLVL